jgi:ferrous iron transport protein A
MTMEMLDQGAEFVIGDIHLLRETGKRLADMGFTEGAHGRIVRRGFFFGPLQINLGASDIMIRAEEAAGIEVEPIGAFTLYHHGRRGAGHVPGHGMGRGRGRGAGNGWRWNNA